MSNDTPAFRKWREQPTSAGWWLCRWKKGSNEGTATAEVRTCRDGHFIAIAETDWPDTNGKWSRQERWTRTWAIAGKWMGPFESEQEAETKLKLAA